MKKVLVLGAGMVARLLVRYLLVETLRPFFPLRIVLRGYPQDEIAGDTAGQ